MKPTVAATNSASAAAHCPAPTPPSRAVQTTPSRANRNRKRLRRPPRSAIAPSSGAASTMNRLATALPIPSWKVLAVLSRPLAQYCLKNNGKKPAITVVAKAELAQS